MPEYRRAHCQFTMHAEQPCPEPPAAVLCFRTATGMYWHEALCQSHEEPRAIQVLAAGGDVTSAEVLAHA